MRSKRDRSQSSDAGLKVKIWGIHAVDAALRNPNRPVHRLRLTDNARNRMKDAIDARKLTVEQANPKDLDIELGRDTVHQGALLETSALPDVNIEDLAPEPGQIPFVVVLDQVTDPHNVGAILRSAAAFGARAVVMTARNSPPLDGSLAKAASGGLELVPVAIVTNLARAMEQLAELGYFRIGLAGDCENALEKQRITTPVALMLGAEDTGLRRLTRENCDIVCKITTSSALASLNVSNAAAVAMHALVGQRPHSF